MKTERDKRMITELESKILHKVARIEFPYDYGADVKDILLTDDSMFAINSLLNAGLLSGNSRHFYLTDEGLEAIGGASFVDHLWKHCSTPNMKRSNYES